MNTLTATAGGADSLAHLTHALRFTSIACVQNAFHPADRRSLDAG
jgi:hypothetical protein